MTPVKVVLETGGYMPERAHATDAGADIRTPYAFTLAARSSATIRTRLHAAIPQGCVGLIKSKSGLNVKHSIISDGGVIDEGYTGEYVVKVYNLGDAPYHFEAGDKIAQLLIMPVHYPVFILADVIQGGERGDNGFGSTGR